MQVLREEGINAFRYVLWHASGWLRAYHPPAWCNRVVTEQKCIGWEIVVTIETILAVVLHDAHEQQTKEVIDRLAEGLEDFYKRCSNR